MKGHFLKFGGAACLMLTVIVMSLLATGIASAAPIVNPVEQDVAAQAAQISAIASTCVGAPAPRLIPGQQGRVTPGLPNILRSAPGQQPGSVIIGEIPGGAVFDVLAGVLPACYNGRLWWNVRYGVQIGWTPEAEVWGAYWTEPISNIPPTPPPPEPACMGSQLINYNAGVVTPGLPNVIRSQPFRGTGSVIRGYIPAGGIFSVIRTTQPVCSQGIMWVHVVYNGLEGWTGESSGGVRWALPYDGGVSQCNSGAPPRLQAGGYGRVMPGLPNSLRREANVYSQRIGYIYAGEVFRVIEGPSCHMGIPYWRVEINGVTGWTGEGQWGVYWVEPV